MIKDPPFELTNRMITDVAEIAENAAVSPTAFIEFMLSAIKASLDEYRFDVILSNFILLKLGPSGSPHDYKSPDPGEYGALWSVVQPGQGG